MLQAGKWKALARPKSLLNRTSWECMITQAIILRALWVPQSSPSLARRADRSTGAHRVKPPAGATLSRPQDRRAAATTRISWEMAACRGLRGSYDRVPCGRGLLGWARDQQSPVVFLFNPTKSPSQASVVQRQAEAFGYSS